VESSDSPEKKEKMEALRENYRSLSKKRLEEENKRKAAQRDHALDIYMRARNEGVEQHSYFVIKRLEHPYELWLINYTINGLKSLAIVVPIYGFKYSIQAVQLILAKKMDFGRWEAKRQAHSRFRWGTFLCFRAAY